MQNKIVCITGASSGIGEACAHTFAKEKAKIIIFGRRKERIENLADKLTNAYGILVLPLVLDVRNLDDVKQKIDNLPAEWQAIDILVNNAGLALAMDKIQEGNPKDWQTMIDTNIKGLLYLTRTVLPQMIERKTGHIINIGSIAGHESYSGGVVYAATKHAVKAINKGLRLDLVGTNIRVSSVDPGMVETEFSLVRWKGDKEKADKLYQDTRPLTAADIADAVYYCASRPEHVNIQEMIVMPTDQSAISTVYRHSKGAEKWT